ncbi:HAD family hydrolase [Microbacterium bovistercoris]|uniref:HAD family hydrolase n=1 Tax=Microbacterium bovistercoris TaxID=2293570 RepID=A0A371NQK2_9MICO|nr:HAD hydrolase-like protein [Microbacterium bovistercoris]REJ04436.1 HAD family hydrolase [Microbacterium bovistercoris]
MGIRAICWDWNGTLLDDAEICRQVMNRVLATHDREPFPDLAAYRATFRFPIRAFYADAGLGDDVFRPAAEQYLGWLEQRTGEAALHTRAESTVATLTDRGVIQVLASATLTDLLTRQLEPHGLAHRFDRILSITDPFHPSKHEVIAGWLHTSGFAPDEVLMIGDTNHDLEISTGLGTRFVHFDGGHQAAQAGVHSIRSLDEVLALV